LEEVFERDGPPPRWQVQVSQAVDGVLGDRWLTREVGPLQVVVEVYVANEWRNGGAFLDIVEAELHPQPSGNQQVELALNNLDEPRPGSFYEMWFVSEEKYISAGTFTVTPEGRTEVRLSAPPQAQYYPTLLITEESATDATDPGKEVKLRGEVP